MTKLRLAGALSLAAGSLYLLYTVLSVSGAGVDLTDEGFYLLWMRDPWIYSASATQFGFVYHGLYRLLGGDVALLRQFNLLGTYLLSAVFGYLALRDPLPEERPFVRALVATGLAAATFAFPASWLVTPSYNWLVMQAALLIGISFYLIRDQARIAGGLLMGLGGVLAFQAKPTGAAAFAVVALLFFASRWRRTLVPLAVAGASALAGLLFFVFYIDGSVSAYVHRLLEGAHIMGLLAANHTLADSLRLDPIHMSLPETACAAALAAAGLLWLLSLKWRAGAYVGAGLAIAGVAFLILGQPGRTAEFVQAWPFGYFRLLPTLALAAAALVALAIQRVRGVPLPGLRPSLGWGFLFLFFPIAASFGTNNNLWGSASQHALFWIAGGLVLMRPLLPARREAEALVPLVALMIVYVGVTVHLAIAAPYRQTASLDAAGREVVFSPEGRTLRLSADVAGYLEQSRAVARQAGFTDGDWILDFSGRSPTLVYALGGRTPGLAWWTGGYPGTTAMVTYALRDAPCEKLLGAWILAEPGTPLAVDPVILRAFGATENDYDPVAQLTPPTGWGVPQHLLKPKPELAARLATCRELKRN